MEPPGSGAVAPPRYRPDVDGLRAVAILAVLGFHAFPGLVPSGFIGVDVFFVVSGFLITDIILRGLASSTFSFRDFYARRIRRIFPALILVLAAALAIGWFTLASDEYRQLGRHAVGGATFTSNILLWRDSGYFDAASDRKILLHLWSLAIEEQFYIFFPFVLWAAWKKKLKPILVIGAIGTASFIWNVVVHVEHPTMDFYSLRTRAWELMLGAALALLPLRKAGRTNDAAAALGVVLLGAGAFLITKQSLFPGWWALLPTLGTALLIHAGPEAWINRVILSLKPLVWLGLISYPLYLWHWPLLSYAHVLEGGTPSRTLKLAIVFLSIALAALTYAWVERPMRLRKPTLRLSLWLLAPLLVLGGVGLAAHLTRGFGGRQAATALDAKLATARPAVEDGECIDAAPSEGFCKVGVPSAEPSAFVYGDSHATTMLPALTEIAHAQGKSYLYAGASVCPPLLGVRTAGKEFSRSQDCRDLNQEVFAYVRDHGIRNVILIARWAYYTDGYLAAEPPITDVFDPGAPPHAALQEGLKRTTEAYRAIGVRVILLGDNPLQSYAPKDALRKSDGSEASINAHSVRTSEYLARQGWAMDALAAQSDEGVSVLDLAREVYCGEERCPLMRDGDFLYADLDHLSGAGARAAVPFLGRELSSIGP